MALTLLQAENRVRELTRHDDDTERVTQDQIRFWLYRDYCTLRTWLQDVDESAYLICSDTITVAEGDSIQLISATATFERLRRVEYEASAGSGRFREMMRASDIDPNRHASNRATFRKEGQCLKFGPDDNFSGDVRVLFYATPPALTADDDLFNLPVVLELPLILLTCGWVGIRDGDGPKARKEFHDQAGDVLYGAGGSATSPRPGSVMATFKQSHGVHPDHSGLRRVLGR